jgi:tRNA dimethylallyltransferase
VTLLVIVGPTASGKTELALRLAGERPAEIVSADSVQVYRHFNVGTSKPDAEQRARAVHHLIDCIEPLEPMDAARWAELAEAAIADIRSRGKVPIVCGGSFLYIKALLFGLAPAPPADQALRRRHQERAVRDGRAVLHVELSRVDPATAARLSPNDLVRVSRALEVYELTGIPMGQWQMRHGFGERRYDAKLVGVKWPRAELDRRIYERAAVMLHQGWIAEVNQLLMAGYGAARAMRSVGYRQIAEALRAGPLTDPSDLLDSIAQKTRVFARHQRTWLRDQPVLWLSPDRLATLRWEEVLEGS